jgi:Uma2 family endonuclease
MNAEPRSSWLLTVGEYLAFEEQSDTRYEYVGGEIHAMTGASERHQIIVFNVASALREAARAQGCRAILKRREAPRR